MPHSDPYRLPRSVLPHRYDLHLVPDLDAATFTGTVAVEVEVTEAVSEVVLNAIELTIDSAEVVVGDRRIAATVSMDEEHERATLALAEAVAAGPAVVVLSFAGILNDRLHGFYRSTFTDDDGATRTIATTQFEATDARRAFPCWDEPEFKAVFAITLDVPDDLFAVSNAAEVSAEALDGGRRRVRFADTMVMSTYLVAFIVGPLVATDPVDVDGVPLRVVHRAGQEDLTAFALESGAFALRYFAEYFGRPYPADKLDLIAIPDFAFGAMENLGCVTFRDALLCIDPERSTQGELQRVADVIHHEIAHMWFGDLVTMRWWNGIWLNEAFATFMEMRCTDAFRPEWDRWTDFGISRTAAFDTDALTSTRPIEFEVVSPHDAEGMFDVLTYEKGAAVVRMLEQYLGEDRFRDGIRLYIDRHAHGNTETTDLWDAIEEATGEPVRRIMDSWILQGGHPEVTVARTDGGSSIRLSQARSRYARADGDSDTEGDDALWAVPVLARWSSGTAAEGGTAVSGERLERVLLDGPSAELDLGGPAPWVLVNSGGSGFFRVRYDREGREALAATGAALTALERYGLVDDAWASLLAGSLEVGDLLRLLRASADETDLSVWQRIAAVLGGLDRLVADEDRPALQAWVRALVGSALLRTGPEPVLGEPARDAARRATLFATLGTIGADPEIRERAQQVLARADAGDVDADLLDAAVRVLAATGDAATFADFRARAAAGTTPQERLRYLGALADFPGEAEVGALLEAALTDEVRSQDAPFVLRRALTNRERGPQAWAFVSRRFAELSDHLPSNTVARMLEGVRSFTDAALAREVQAFVAEHPVPQAARLVVQHLERMETNVALVDRTRGDLGTALTKGPG